MSQKLISSRIVAITLVIPSILTIAGLSSLNSFITADFPLQPEKAFAQDQQSQSTLSGQFMGVGDGIHDAEGIAKQISLEDGRQFVRFENFKVTNGPDLFVYLATDKSASDFVDLGKLKANNGNQNYQIPPGTDLSKYNTVVIWCKAFSVLFGSAELKA
jgi:Electron transfer DM13